MRFGACLVAMDSAAGAQDKSQWNDRGSFWCNDSGRKRAPDSAAAPPASRDSYATLRSGRSLGVVDGGAGNGSAQALAGGSCLFAAR